MMTFLRRQSQTVLIIILGVLGLSFLFYGNVGSLLTNGGGRGGANDYGRIDGEDISVAELYGAIRNARYALLLQGHAQDLNAAGARKELAEEGWRQLLLQHEAERLHLEISDQELVDFIKSRPAFQKNGVYDPATYQQELTNLETNLHITPDGFESLIRSNLQTEEVRRALFSSVHAPTGHAAAQYDKYFGPSTVTVATLDPQTFANTATVAPDAIEAEYKAHPDNPAYRTAEKRQVDYVLIGLTPDQLKLDAKAKQSALEALGEKALDFAVAFQPDPSATGTPAAPPPDFVAEAKKRGLNPATTDFFTADSPPTGLPPSPAFNSAAFALSSDDPVSKVVQLENGVAVLHLAQVQPSEVRPLAEVKDVIAKQLQKVQSEQALIAAARNDGQALKDALAKGTDFATAAAALKLKVTTLPEFVPARVKPTNPVITDIAEPVSGLEVGQVSEPIAGADGSVIFAHLDRRGPGDPAGLAAFTARFDDSQSEQMRTLVYLEWTNWLDRQPGTHKPPDLEAFGGVE